MDLSNHMCSLLVNANRYTRLCLLAAVCELPPSKWMDGWTRRIDWICVMQRLPVACDLQGVQYRISGSELSIIIGNSIRGSCWWPSSLLLLVSQHDHDLWLKLAQFDWLGLFLVPCGEAFKCYATYFFFWRRADETVRLWFIDKKTSQCRQ